MCILKSDFGIFIPSVKEEVDDRIRHNLFKRFKVITFKVPKLLFSELTAIDRIHYFVIPFLQMLHYSGPCGHLSRFILLHEQFIVYSNKELPLLS